MSNFAQPRWKDLPHHQEQVLHVKNAFKEKYGVYPDGVWSAPGRLNLLGEYIDFLGGSCLPMPLPYRTYIAGKLRTDGVLRAESLQMPADERTVVIRDIQPGNLKGWFTYVAGVAWSMNQEGGKDIVLPKNFGADLLIDSHVPVGGGLSSSAALECSTILALLDLSCPLREDCDESEPLPSDRGPGNDALRSRLAQVCIRAENDVAGARTGGLDQTTSLRSKPHRALAIDFRDFSIEPLEADVESAGLGFLVINTNTPHELSGGEFAVRRAAAEACAQALGLDYLRNALPEDLSCSQLDEHQAKLWRLSMVDTTTVRALDAFEGTEQPPQFPRGWVRHTFHDMCLVERATFLLRNMSDETPHAWSELGHLFTESFISMRDELRVSRPEIDLAVNVCLENGALGARMVGGGFGGAVMALIDRQKIPDAARSVAQAYTRCGYASPEFLPMVAGFPADKDI
ncbi:galactokinase [Rothia sp. CCM 9418]|uniref:galactokinase n=1 Tax=Rothia sp. CCM 9418 TaxID=3402661 RepID=UPI003AE98E4B